MDTTPPTPPDPTAEARTREHLRVLGIFHILFGLLALPGLLIIPFHGLVMTALEQALSDPSLQGELEGMEDTVRLLVSTLFWSVIVLTIAHVLAFIWVGLSFRRQKHHLACLLASIFACLSLPLGTILGIFSIVVLSKPEAKALFERNRGGG